jgi:damage-control phosphatase, subfamily I
MKTQLECIGCLVNQVTKICEEALPGQEQNQMKLTKLALKKISESDFLDSPPAIANKMHRIIKKELKNPDLYKSIKDQANQLVLALLPKLEVVIAAADDQRKTALLLAIGGNIIDAAIGNMPTEDEIQIAVEQSLESSIEGDVQTFIHDIEQAKKILYLCDNTGEICLDKLLIKQIGPKKVCVAVRGLPILNDATMEDAVTCGLTDIVKVIDNGSDAPGTLLNECTPAFQKAFSEADLIISKGQGNYESLSDIKAPIYFLLKVKCQVISKQINLPMGALLLRKSASFNPSYHPE